MNPPTSPAAARPAPPPLAADVRSLWSLDSAVAFLNHGSFGAAPRAVLVRQQALRDEMEREPVDFFERKLWPRLDAALATLGAFVDAPADCLGFVTNATEGVHAAVRSTHFAAGDEIISTAHAYDAVANLLKHTAAQLDLRVHFIDVELPFDADRFVESIATRITTRTKLIVVDHITSISAIVYPIERVVQLASERGIAVIVDGAHAPGMLDLSIGRIRPTCYTGNCHKWMCAPKGAGFLYVDDSRFDAVHPNTISNFYGRGFHDEFAWQGTRDMTPWLCVPTAIEFFATRFGWNEVREHNHSLACWARDMLCEAWNVQPICGESEFGSMFTIPLPQRAGEVKDRFEASKMLFENYQVEVPIVDVNGRRMVRPSCQIYNTQQDYERLREAVIALWGGTER